MFRFEYYFKTKLICIKTTVGTFLQMLKIKLDMLLLGTFSNFRYTSCFAVFILRVLVIVAEVGLLFNNVSGLKTKLIPLNHHWEHFNH